MEKRYICGNCPYWASEKGIIGDCRANAPTLGIVGENSNGEFPRTSSGTWCGKHPQLDAHLQVMKTITAILKNLQPA